MTDHQEKIKKEILQLNREDGPCYISVEGSAGTGKTLLIYDIAKHYIIDKDKVLIIHCATLNEGHRKLKNDYSWDIYPIKGFESIDFSKYDVIVFDESQRLYQYQVEFIIDKIKELKIKIIFSYDKQQCLATWEIDNDIPGFISNKLSPAHFELTEKIRTNKEIASFIKNLFDLSKRNPNQAYSNVEIHFFDRTVHAKEFIEILENKNWKVINYTPSQRTTSPFEKYQKRHNDSAHKVIGQEFDNVVAVLDPTFYYDENGVLAIRGFKPYYHLTKMLFQIVTRARKKLAIIIINNEVVLEECLNIIMRNKKSK